MAALFVLSVFAVLSLGYCGNFTVTEEAWFDVEVKDLDGPGDDFRGRFVIGLFGETAPMTAMNFAAIAKGFKRGRVSRLLISCELASLHLVLSIIVDSIPVFDNILLRNDLVKHMYPSSINPILHTDAF